MAEEESGSQPAAGDMNQVDLEELARKIYEIFLRELLLENERTGR
jgi:hypothetical protein